jgi:hypothetical protein
LDEQLQSSLRVMLQPYYEDILISHVSARFSDLFTWMKDAWVWTVHCRRSSLLRLPLEDENRQKIDWRREVKNWFDRWALENQIFLLGSTFKIQGRLRKDPTFTFETYRVEGGPAPRQEAQAEGESHEPTPEEFLSAMSLAEGWPADLRDALWKFHPYGCGYTVWGIGQMAVVTATTYFPPNQDDYAARFKQLVVDWLVSHEIMPVKEAVLRSQKAPGRSNDYPEWNLTLWINTSFRDITSLAPLHDFSHV